MSDTDVAQILHHARQNNIHNGITGMLLFCDDNFLQLLEGEDAAVEATFERIKHDTRHADIRVLLNEKVSQRAFTDWSMGFEKLQKTSDPDAEAAFEISRMAIERRIAPGNFWVVRRMMETFYEINTRKQLDLTTFRQQQRPALIHAAG